MMAKYARVDKDMKKVVDAAISRGWTLATGKHYSLIHPSGKRIGVSLSPSDTNAPHSLRRHIERIEREQNRKHDG